MCVLPHKIRGDDSLEVSLLTCAPGHEVYRLYGHTALRVRNVEQPTQDDTYNFGWFSFNTPNFIMRFVLGRTDYSMAKESTALFVQTYIEDDAPVTAQVLDLTPAEARDVQRALNAIIEEHHTEVREYLVPNLSGGAGSPHARNAGMDLSLQLPL